LIALILCLLPATARANELLVMPYACSVIGGRLALNPGPEVGHRILGPREERRFTACSPVNPNLCRQWTVYRFELDCDGERVPWVSVVAAAGAMERSARLVNGRLQVRMPPRWSLSPDDPCAEEPDYDDRFAYRRMRRYCNDRMATTPPVVEMPPGFAPMLNLDGIFVRGGPKVAGAPPASSSAAGVPPAANGVPGGHSDQAAEPSPWRPQAEREPLVKDPVGQAPPAPSAFDPRPAPNAAPVPPSPPAEAPKSAAAPSSQAPPSESPKAALPAPKVAMAPPAPPKQAAPPSATPAEPERSPVSLNLFNALRPATAGAIVVFAGLALGLLTAFAVARRRERLAHAGAHPRDFSPLTFDDPHDESMPRTRAQALQVLGMAPSANLAAIKKIVDGLRVSWHPDLATGEADRRLRELRSKQINAAWEILQRQRTDA
jgi:hypothetical protein